MSERTSPEVSESGMSRGATISSDGLYRYELWRWWSAEPRMVFVMLNPSTADATFDDPTIRRCMGFARREGWGGIHVVNLFALRCTRPVHLFDKSISDDPNGSENVETVDAVVKMALDLGAPVCLAWGAFPKAYRSTVFQEFFKHNGAKHWWCLGMTGDGSPKHPLYLRGDAPLEIWPKGAVHSVYFTSCNCTEETP